MQILTFKEVCDFLGVGRNTLYDWIHTEGFPHIQVKEGGKFLFSRQRIIHWLEKRENPIPARIRREKLKNI